MTWARNIARPDRSWVVWAEVTGLGDVQGLWRLCVEPGWSLSAGQGRWLPYLAEFPDILSQRIDPAFGGAAQESGSLTLAIVDARERLTEILRLDGDAIGLTSTPITDSATSWSTSVIGAVVGDLWWVGTEVVRVTGSGTVARAQLGTVARAHRAGQPIYPAPWYLEQREVRLYAAPGLGPDSERRLLGVYVIDEVSLDDEHASWRIVSSGRQPTLSLRVPREPETALLRWVPPSRRTRSGSPFGGLGGQIFPARWIAVPRGATEFARPFGSRVAIRLVQGDEVLTGRLTTAGYAVLDAPEGLEIGPARRVLSVETEDFAATGPGDATSNRASSAWVPVRTWVEVLLCVLCSPSRRGEPADNYDPTPDQGWQSRNFSGLVAGYGAGIAWPRIDWASFEEVARSGLNYEVPFFELRDTSTLGEVIDGLIKPSGVALVEERGQIRLRPLTPLLEGVALDYEIGRSTLVLRGDLPDVSTRRWAPGISEIELTIGPEDVASPVTVRWADALDIADPRDELVPAPRGESIAVLGGDPADEVLWTQLGLRALRRAYRPRTELEVMLEAGAIEARLLDSALVDLPGIPDFRGLRGIEGRAQIVEIEPRFDPDRGLLVSVRALVEPRVRAARISASATVLFASGNVLTVTSNRFAKPDARGLPTSDAAAFIVGDVVGLRSPAGVPKGSPATQIVTAVDTDEITLNGNFGGAIATSDVIVFAGRSAVTTRQVDLYAYAEDGSVYS